MGKQKQKKSEYNTFLDGEKLNDNAGIRTSLQDPGSSLQRTISPPPTPITAKTKREEKGKQKGREKKPKKPPLTHFLCLPLINERSKSELAQALDRFAKDVEEKRIGVPRKAIRPVGTMHLTLGVMSLDKEALEEVRQFLSGEELDLRKLLSESRASGAGVEGEGTEQGEQSEQEAPKIDSDAGADRPTPLTLDLRALHPMQSPKKTSILYAEPVDATSRLLPFADALRRTFMEKGWVIDDKRPLRLHATVLNTVYAMPRGRGGGGGKWMGKGKKKGERMGREKEREKVRKREQMLERDEESGIGEGEEVVDVDEEVQEEVNSADRTQGHGPDSKGWMRFDASALIKEYKKFVWAEGVVVGKVQICKMGARKILDESGEVVDEEYEVVFERAI
ncbi:uncharacterized protein EI97DRAFT_384692 [Westerdykella ornata]|uniref:A-kinase anchor protein 7-like phosphoesterase domain-containing protein n=1 Tax=Westerdykella ornata TaxID=318751 RepID=A0A6A6J952_WESOR|nr:uncharacterized protein EI97DRAFT_384692 [Westerdykella ornata]KAF2272922.1 hypothetical protein EI97DRAFT_384692 [Westerdykella ornata]